MTKKKNNGVRAAMFAAMLAAGGALVPMQNAAAAVDAAAAQRIYRLNACASCHAVDRKLIGPSYTDVAAKYKNDPGAGAHLAEVVKNGGSGVWGAIPMPSHPRMSDADIRTVVDWILAGAPAAQ
jgi:cytochrome c